MVLGVCRRVLRDEHVAADAFQSVFLVLAQKARSVRVDDSLGRWLHGVSIRVARRMRSVFFAERARVKNLAAFDRADPAKAADKCEQAEVRSAIDDEIARLPSRYRRAVVYCYLEGLTQEQAAKRLRVRSEPSKAACIVPARGCDPASYGAGCACGWDLDVDVG